MRTAQIHRVTKETDIQAKLNLDGSGICHTDTSIGFFDHMITALTVHSGIDLDLKVVGDIIVDCHHSVEDAGIVLGQAFAQALGDRSGIAGTVTPSFPWMKLWLGRCWTFPDVPSWCLTPLSPPMR